MYRFMVFVLFLSFVLYGGVVSAQTFPVTIGSGLSEPGTIYACPGSTVTALLYTVTNGSSSVISDEENWITVTGTGNLGTDATGMIYKDLNNNGLVDPTDPGYVFSTNFFGSGWPGDDIYCYIPANSFMSFIVTLTFNTSAPIGATYQLNTQIAPGEHWVFDGAGGGPAINDEDVSGPLIVISNCAGTPTSTISSTATNSATPTWTATGTSTNSPTASDTPTPSGPTSTPTNTFTATSTSTMTATGTPTITWTATPTSTLTATFTFTPTFTNTVPTNTPTLTFTTTSTATATHTVTPSSTATVTLTYTPTTITQPVFSAPYPNPASTGPVQINVNTPGSASIRMTVFTAANRKILDRSVQTGKGMGGYLGIPTTVSWDLKDEMGFPVANGLYYIRLKLTGNSTADKIFKVLVLR